MTRVGVMWAVGLARTVVAWAWWHTRTWEAECCMLFSYGNGCDCGPGVSIARELPERVWRLRWDW